MSDEKQVVPANENKSLPISFGEGVTKKALAALKRKYKKVPDFDTKEGYAEGKKSLSILTKTRTGLEVERKLQVAAALKHQGNVNTAAKEIREEIEAIEKPIRDARKEVDDRKEREKREEQEKEQRRIDKIEGMVAGIYAMTEGLLTADLPTLEERLAEAQAIEITEDEYMEFVEPAKLAVTNTTSTLTNAVESRRVLAEQEAGLAERKEELEKTTKANALKDSVQRIRMAPIDLMGKSVPEIQVALDKMERIDVDDAYGDLASEATEVITATAQQLQTMIEHQKSVDAHAADLVKQKEEQEQKEADDRKKADDKLNADKLKARMPEDQKLRSYAEALGNVELPEIEDVQLKAVLVASLDSLANIKDYIFDSTQSAE